MRLDCRLPTTPERMRWGWEDGILLYGLARAGQVEAVACFHKTNARGPCRIDRADLCAPGLSALVLAREHGCAVGIPGAARVARFIARAPRNRYGAIDHLGASPLRLLVPASMWIDSLAMLAVFAAQWGAYVGDAAMLDFAAAQPAIYAAKLRDPRAGLFRHAYVHGWRRAVPRAPAFWLRGNGWALLAMVDIAAELPARHPAVGEIVDLLAATAAALARWQRSDGSWGTLVNDDSSYSETSGTALVAYALAQGARRGWLPPAMAEAALRAVRFVRSRIDDRGSLGGSSGPTNAMPSWLYPLVPRMRDAPWGVGAALLAASVIEG